MFKIGETILYSSTGICKIESIEEKDLGSIKKQYFVLQPVSNENNKVYVPVDSAALTSKMHRILSKEEVLEIIHSSAQMPDIWVENDNQRRETFTKIVSSGDRRELLIMIRSLYDHREQQLANGRKFHIADERIFKEAERLLNDELSYTLGIEPEDVAEFIRENLNA